MKRFEAVTTFYYRGETFKIVKCENYYMAINTKDIDENGVLTKSYNGINGHATKSIQKTINSVKYSLDVDILMQEGHSLEDALNMAMA